MKGKVKLTDKDINVLSKAIEVIENFTPEIIEFEQSKWWGLKKETIKKWKDIPYWYCAKDLLIEELYDLMSLLYSGVDVELSLTAYSEIVKLSKGDYKANPEFILNY